MSGKIVNRASAVDAINKMNENDLRFLNHLIVDRLKLLSQSRATHQMANFTPGDRVGFKSSEGKPIEGVILRHNTKTVSILSDDGNRWKVSPGFLHLIRRVRH